MAFSLASTATTTPPATIMSTPQVSVARSVMFYPIVGEYWNVSTAPMGNLGLLTSDSMSVSCESADAASQSVQLVRNSIASLRARIVDLEEEMSADEMLEFQRCANIAEELIAAVEVSEAPIASVSEDRGLILQWGDSRSPAAALVAVYPDGHVEYFVRSAGKKVSRSGSLDDLAAIISEDFDRAI